LRTGNNETPMAIRRDVAFRITLTEKAVFAVLDVVSEMSTD